MVGKSAFQPISNSAFQLLCRTWKRPRIGLRGRWLSISVSFLLGALGSLVAPFGLVPVHRVPPRVYVLRTPVLILQVVGVLPHVQPYYRCLALHQGRVLVSRLLDGERTLGGGYEPHPPR